MKIQYVCAKSLGKWKKELAIANFMLKLIIMDELKNQLAQYLCSQIHNSTKDLIELIESEDLINEQWYKNWKEEMRILLQEK